MSDVEWIVHECESPAPAKTNPATSPSTSTVFLHLKMGNFILHVSVTVANLVLVNQEFTLPGPQILPVDIPIRIRIAVGQ